MKAKHRRARHRRDRAWFGRARARFCGLLRSWAYSTKDPAEFRARTQAIGDAMLKHGLLASGCPHGLRFAVCVHWRRTHCGRRTQMPATRGLRQTTPVWSHWRMLDRRHNVALMFEQQFRLWQLEQAKTG